MASFKVAIMAKGDDGTTADLGNVVVEAPGREQAQQQALDALWDARLDAAGCSPRMTVEELPAHMTAGPAQARRPSPGRR